MVRKFYGLGIHHETLAEIADDMSLKRERVRQIRDKAIRKISKNASSKVLKHFLRNNGYKTPSLSGLYPGARSFLFLLLCFLVFRFLVQSILTGSNAHALVEVCIETLTGTETSHFCNVFYTHFGISLVSKQ